MVGTAALPHILMRYYTTPSVKEARESVTWSLFFIFLLYFTAPALAVLVKYEVFNVLVGTPFDQLPAWIANWARVDPTLLSVADVNKDGIFQLGEMRIGGDIIVLATPEIGGLPYVISGMVAAGGLAAALSTADGLLLTIANALSHDLYYKMIDPNASDVAPRRDLQGAAAGGGPGGGAAWRRRSRRTSCSWCRRRSRSRRRRSSRRWCSASSGSAPTSGAPSLGMIAGLGITVLLHGDDAALDARRVRRDQRRSSCGGASSRSRPACSACRSASR